MQDIESTPPGLGTRRTSESVGAEILRWLLLLPIAAGAAAILGVLPRFGILYFAPADTVASNLVGFTIEALGYGVAVYLGGKVAPRGGRWIAIFLAAAFIAIEVRHATRSSSVSPPYEVLTTLVACATSAWLFWSHGRSGFRRTWAWIAVVVLPVGATLFLTVALSRRIVGSGSVSEFSKQYRGDGIAFRYPPEWTLTVGEWTHQTGSPSMRELDLKRLGGEGLTIFLSRPPVDVDPTDFHRHFQLPGATPVSPVTETAVVVTGRRIVGTRRDYSMTRRGETGNFRVEIVSLRGKEQTIRVFTTATLEKWSTVEGRFRLFFEHFTFE